MNDSVDESAAGRPDGPAPGLEALMAPRAVQKFLRERGLAATKAMGQNFLVNREILRRIVAGAGVAPGDTVLEIGPGLGFLTHFLLGAGARVTAFEMDRGLAAHLAGHFAGEERLRLEVGDFLAADLRALVPGDAFDVVANLPYNITAPVFDKLLSDGRLRRMTVMVQRQVAERIVAAPGTREYGAFSLLCRFYAEPKLLFHVSPGNFHPAPAVYSSIVRLDVHEPLLAGAEREAFFRLTKSVFSSRRKTVFNSLRGGTFLGLDGERAQAALAAAGVDPGARGETMDAATFARLAVCIAGGNPPGA